MSQDRDPTTRLIKQPSESILYTTSFANLLNPGETISSVVSVTASPTGLTISNEGNSGTKVTFRAAGGTAGVVYRIAILVTTSAGNTREGDGLLEIVELAATPTISASKIVTVDDVMVELGWDNPTAGEQSILENAIQRAVGAVRQHLHYDPILGSHTELRPLQSYQASGDGAVWEANDTQAYLRKVSGAATNEIQLTHLPVRSITSLKIDYSGKNATADGSFTDDCLKTEGVDFWPNYDTYDGDGNKVCRDGVLRTTGLWPTTPGCVLVAYTAGYSDTEFRGGGRGALDATPIWQAVLDETCRRVRRAVAMKKGALGLPVGVKTAESLGGYSYSIDGRAADRLNSAGVSPETIALLQPFVNWGVCLGS